MIVKVEDHRDGNATVHYYGSFPQGGELDKAIGDMGGIMDLHCLNFLKVPAPQTVTKPEDESCMGVTRGLRGWYAVLYECVTGEPEQTGIASFETEEEAWEDAVAWALDEGVPLGPGAPEKYKLLYKTEREKQDAEKKAREPAPKDGKFPKVHWLPVWGHCESLKAHAKAQGLGKLQSTGVVVYAFKPPVAGEKVPEPGDRAFYVQLAEVGEASNVDCPECLGALFTGWLILEKLDATDLRDILVKAISDFEKYKREKVERERKK